MIKILAGGYILPLKAFPTTKQVKLIRKKDFAVVALNLVDETFVVYVTFIGQDSNIYASCETQIAFLKVDEALISSLSEYTNFIDVFFNNLAVKLWEHTRINDHTINLVEG